MIEADIQIKWPQTIINNKFMQSEKYPKKVQHCLDKPQVLNQNNTANQTVICLNNPLQSRSLKASQNLLETSFELQARSEHAQNIWNASINFAEKCLHHHPSLRLHNGLNEESIFDDSFEMEEGEKDLEEAIQKNKLLKNEQIHQFLIDLSSQKDFKNLLTQLQVHFRQEIFHQILYVCHLSWEKYLTLKQNHKVSENLANLNFNTILDFDQEFDIRSQPQYNNIDSDEIELESKKVAEEISGLVFLDKKIKYINLMEAEAQNKKVNIREEFMKFMEQIVKGVFFCVEGYYVQPDEQRNNELMFFDEEVSFGEYQGNQDDDYYVAFPLHKRKKTE